MINNRQIEDVLRNLGGDGGDGFIAKSVVGLDNTDFAALLPIEFVEALITDIKDKSAILSAITTYQRTSMAGTVPIIRLNEPTMEHVAPNQGGAIGVKPATDRVQYICKKFRSDLLITHEELREARKMGIADFENKLVDMWTTQLSNDLAKMVIQSDDTLAGNTREERMLNAFDGLLVSTDTGATVMDANGAGFAKGIFDILIDNMPDDYSDDPNLAWIFNQRVNNRWKASLGKLGTALGDSALTTSGDFTPHGIRKIITPQIPSTLGASGTPDGAADDGDGTITIKVNTLSGGQAEANAGRKFRVWCEATGAYETLVSTWDTSDVIISTVGALGQQTISTTAADYTVKLFDETQVFLCNPLGLILVICEGWRSTREYNKDYDRVEITTYIETDFLIPLKEAIVKYKELVIPPMSTFTAETLP